MTPKSTKINQKGKRKNASQIEFRRSQNCNANTTTPIVPTSIAVETMTPACAADFESGSELLVGEVDGFRVFANLLVSAGEELPVGTCITEDDGALAGAGEAVTRAVLAPANVGVTAVARVAMERDTDSTEMPSC